ncbi:MAG: cell division protein FtsZ [Chloroflexi bacterium]|nr:cell division protein FtsZ [Chloroflexota bacterium]
MGQANPSESLAKIKVVGVGGGGCNAIGRMVKDNIQGIEFLAVNTDAQALARCAIPTRIRIGDKLTRGLGVGGNPTLGAEAAEESRDELKEALRGADMVFIAAGMGGGTGTGAAPVVAEIAKETGALTVGIITKPFGFEGARRRRQADEGATRLKEKVDTLIAVTNDRLLDICDQKVSVETAFRLADDVLRQGITAISDLITFPGEINLDFADVRAIMAEAGAALMGIGYGSGEKRAVDAAHHAIQNPLLDLSIDGAKGVLLNVTGGPDLTLYEVNQAAAAIGEVVHEDANIIFGMVTDEKMEHEVKVTVIATGFAQPQQQEQHRDEQIKELMANAAQDFSDLDIPPFLRRTNGGKPKARTGKF